MRPSLGSDAETAGPPPFENMRWIPSREFRMGSEDFYPEEWSVHRVAVDGFWMDERPVTAAEFRHFVWETSYVTFCERSLDPGLYPNADPDFRCIIRPS